MSLLLTTALLIVGSFAAIDNPCAYPKCELYYNGCNECFCGLGTFMACTFNVCEYIGNKYCKTCPAGSYWLRYDTSPSLSSCDSQFQRFAMIQQDNSRCGCPSSHPFYYEGIGCIKTSDCPGTIGGEIADPTSVTPFVLQQFANGNGPCSYDYQTCSTDSDCGDGLICNVPQDNFETCVPLLAHFDQNCEVIADSGDCMGSGVGYCAKNADCMTTGCSGQICASEETRTTCEYKCEYMCNEYRDCQRYGINGACSWVSDTQHDFKQCLNLCGETPADVVAI